MTDTNGPAHGRQTKDEQMRFMQARITNQRRELRETYAWNRALVAAYHGHYSQLLKTFASDTTAAVTAHRLGRKIGFGVGFLAGFAICSVLWLSALASVGKI